MKLITLEDDFPVLNPECRLIREFNAIIIRDRGSKGDAQGRQKKLATLELAFVHFMTYYNSEFVTSYSEDERQTQVIKHLNLPEGWKPDAVVQLACMTYKELVSTPSMDSLVEVRESLFSANKIIKILRRRLENRLQELDTQITGADDDEAEEKMQKEIDKTTKEYDKIMDIAKRMPDTLNTVNSLEERVKKEMMQEQKGRKKVDINEFEM